MNDDFVVGLSTPLTRSRCFSLPIFFFNYHSQKADNVEKISAAATTIELKNAALEYRRCIILGLVGSTSSTSPALERILENGYLDHVKIWLDDILNGTAGESVSNESCSLVP
jgi:hypothetical protein